jgi:guanylate kinase
MAAERGKLVVITGPSGVGKSTILAEALRRTDAVYSVSATTRPPREGEKDGVSYSFVDRETFRAMIERGELLEWAEVYGHYYGTPAGPIREHVAAGRTVLMDIDVQGGLQVHRRLEDRGRFVLILPPDEQTLLERLSGRGSEDPQTLQRRFREARKEIQDAQASGVYTHTIVNDDLQTAIERVVEVIREEDGE